MNAPLMKVIIITSPRNDNHKKKTALQGSGFLFLKSTKCLFEKGFGDKKPASQNIFLVEAADEKLWLAFCIYHR